MTAIFKVIALSSLDPEGVDRKDEPCLSYADAMKMAEQMKAQGTAFRVYAEGTVSDDEMQSLIDLGAVV